MSAMRARAQADIKGKLIEFGWQLKKQGFSEYTVKNYVEMLKLLKSSGANLLDPESVKETLAKTKKTEDWKYMAICAYSKFAETYGLAWRKPKVKRARRLPFIPLERELDDLIAASSRRTAAFLQLLKESGMRAGEALKLKWTDVDFERRIITLNAPEKGGNPRAFKISPKLIEMLNGLPKKSERLFPVSYTAIKCSFLRVRKKLAFKLQNPRLMQISFHTYRHWKATMEYHKTKDPLYVKEMLGHKKLDTTLLYIQIERTLFQSNSDEFTVKIAKTPEEIQSLLSVGFEWVGMKDGLVYLRKRI
jgi:integrase